MLNRRPANRRATRTAKVTVPAPIGGLNTRDALDTMPPTDAIRLDNWTPGVGALAVREGYAVHAAGIGAAAVRTLAEFHAGTTRRLIAGGGGALYDATAAPARLRAGFSSDRWQTVNFNGRMGLVNGADAPLVFDGNALSPMAVSGAGLRPAEIVGVMTHRSRTYFFEKHSQDFWFSEVNALGGKLTRFPLSRVGQFGGNLVCMGSWNVEGGSDVWGGGGVGEDMAVFCMSSGDMVIYRGGDPGSDWSLVGVFRGGAPVDVRGIARRGPDLLVLTGEGLVSVSRLVGEGTLAARGVVSDKIRPSLVRAVAEHRDGAGWQVLVHPAGDLGIVNVPPGAGPGEQYVFNIRTGAWARWTGLAAAAWGLFGDAACFGDGAGRVCRQTGHSDDGAAIAGEVQSAFNAFGARGALKRCACLRPVFLGKGKPVIGIAAQADFHVAETGPAATPFGPVADSWENTATGWTDWDDHGWEGAPAVAFSEWRAAEGLGYALGARLTSSSSDALRWETLTYQIETGQGMF